MNTPADKGIAAAKKDAKIAQEIKEMEKEVLNDHEVILDGIMHKSDGLHLRPCTLEELTKSLINARINAKLHANCSKNRLLEIERLS